MIYLLGSLIFALVLLLCLRRMRKLDEREAAKEPRAEWYRGRVYLVCDEPSRSEPEA